MRSVFLQRPGAEGIDRLTGVKRFLFIWLPVLLGMAVIAMESTPTFSAANTGFWLRPIAERLFGPLGRPELERLNHVLRKSGHFTGYGTLCVLFLRAWLLTLARNTAVGLRSWRLRSWMLALLSTFLVASCDELHQSFLPSRTGLFSDVLLDTGGGLVLSGLVLGLSWRAVRS